MDSQRRVVSGMRPSGRLHLGHYHGVLKNWVRLQHEYECFFCIVDWHALTTDYESSGEISQNVMSMAVDWLAAGVSPSSATLFIQSQVPEHAELHLLLSMICPLGWLERVPSYKELQQNLQDKNLDTYGFLGYPLLQAADILLYRAGLVPVGADQLPHIEFARDVARRFNHLYGREDDFESKAEAAIRKLGKKTSKLYVSLRKSYQEQGDVEALNTARAVIKEQQTITIGDQERLYGYLEGCGKLLLPEPQALLGEAPAVRARRRQDGQVQQQRHLSAGYADRDRGEDPPHAHRPGARAPQRPRRADALPGVADASGAFRGGRVSVGRAGLSQRRHRLPGMQGTADRFDQGRSCAAAGTRAGLRAEPRSGTQHSGRGAERARDEARETLIDVRQAMGLNYR